MPQFLYQICLSHYFQGNLFVSGYFTESHCLQIVCIICLSHYLLRNLIVSIFLRKCICPWLSLPNLFVSVLRKSRCLSYFQHDPTTSKEICLSQDISQYLTVSKLFVNLFISLFRRNLSVSIFLRKCKCPVFFTKLYLDIIIPKFQPVSQVHFLKSGS